MAHDIFPKAGSDGPSADDSVQREPLDENSVPSLDLFPPAAPSSGSNQSGWFSGKVGLLIGVGIGLVLGVGVVGSRLGSAPSDAAQETVETVAAATQTVTVAPAEALQVSRTLDATGTVEAYDMLPILPRSTGLQIQQVLVDEGDSVSAGQVMAVLDRAVLESQLNEARANLESAQARVRQQEAALAQAEARFDEAQAQFQRYESLSEDGAISQEDLDTRSTAAATAQEDVRVASANVNSARSEVRSEQAKIQQIQTQLEQTLVKAPADGIVAERMARVGDVTSSSQKLFSIIRDRLLELQVKIPETQLPQVSMGAPVEITSDADPRIQLQGRVREIAPLVDAETREATVTIELPASDLLRPGMFLRASLITAVSPGVAVPAEAVLPQSDGPAIVYRLVEGDRAEAVTVELGELLGSGDPATSRIEIRQGLAAGDRVIVAGAGYVKDGDRVTVVDE